ncbi:MAG: hypothetical protein ACKVW3_13175 [Phycisphaerales bacterium]
MDAVIGWVRSWSVPARAEGLPHAHGACVTLRCAGRVIGRGSAWADGTLGLSDTLRSAASAAIAAASDRLPFASDPSLPGRNEEIARQVDISIELAGPLIPITVTKWADALALVEPGVDGVALRLGDKLEALFPDAMLSNATEPPAALRSLLSRLSGDPALGLKEPRDLGLDPSFYRFRVTHLVQLPGSHELAYLLRGGVAPPPLSAAEIGRWASGLAEHLIRRIPDDNSTYPGAFNPVLDLAGGGESGTPAQHALVAFALQRFARTAASFDAEGARRARAAVLRVLRLFDINHGRSDDLFAAALLVRTTDELAPWQGNEEAPFLSRLRARAAGLVSRGTSTVQAVPPGLAGLVAWATQTAVPAPSGVAPEEPTRSVSLPLIRETFVRTPLVELGGAMPWLGWAELAARDRLTPETEVPSAEALRQMREMMWAHTLRPESLGHVRLDLAGGIVFSGTTGVLPTWHAARPLAMVATMLRDPTLTPRESAAIETARLLAALRYLRQLSAGAAEGHMYLDPVGAMWGVRGSVWDQRITPEATATTLLAVCETIEAVGRRDEGTGGRRDGGEEKK